MTKMQNKNKVIGKVKNGGGRKMKKLIFYVEDIKRA